MVEGDHLIRKPDQDHLFARESFLNQTFEKGTAAIWRYSNRVTGHYKLKKLRFVKKTCNCQ